LVRRNSCSNIKTRACLDSTTASEANLGNLDVSVPSLRFPIGLVATMLVLTLVLEHVFVIFPLNRK
jgi:hypothetical protein